MFVEDGWANEAHCCGNGCIGTAQRSWRWRDHQLASDQAGVLIGCEALVPAELVPRRTDDGRVIQQPCNDHVDGHARDTASFGGDHRSDIDVIADRQVDSLTVEQVTEERGARLPEAGDEVIPHRGSLGLTVDRNEWPRCRGERVRADHIELVTEPDDPLAERPLTCERHAMTEPFRPRRDRQQGLGVPPAANERNDHTHHAILTRPHTRPTLVGTDIPFHELIRSTPSIDRRPSVNAEQTFGQHRLARLRQC